MVKNITSRYAEYKLAFWSICVVSTVLTEKIDILGEELRSHFNIEEFSPVSLPAQVHLHLHPAPASWSEINRTESVF